MTAVLYDIATDTDREVTQDDVDRLQRTARAFAELSKRIKFHVSEVRNAYRLPGDSITEIDKSLKVAENMAASLNLDTMLQDVGHVHGRHVMVVER